MNDAARPRFTRRFTAEARHIDELGHVNNSVWVQWVQQLATSHWDAAARDEDQAQFLWVVIRHEIDYRGNIGDGAIVTGETWIEGEPRGATSIRQCEFRNDEGKVLVTARTTWAMLERATGRLARVRADVLRPFRASS
ncbi:MAG: acyl-CoA thioesterase [Erythrobacter sp.]|jgi:acyl-CoA thioester hydrolase|nr:acyl-CoA thioesterase [Erythrobacter sp.]